MEAGSVIFDVSQRICFHDDKSFTHNYAAFGLWNYNLCCGNSLIIFSAAELLVYPLPLIKTKRYLCLSTLFGFIILLSNIIIK